MHEDCELPPLSPSLSLPAMPGGCGSKRGCCSRLTSPEHHRTRLQRLHPQQPRAGPVAGRKEARQNGRWVVGGPDLTDVLTFMSKVQFSVVWRGCMREMRATQEVWKSEKVNGVHASSANGAQGRFELVLNTTTSPGQKMTSKACMGQFPALHAPGLAMRRIPSMPSSSMSGPKSAGMSGMGSRVYVLVCITAS